MKKMIYLICILPLVLLGGCFTRAERLNQEHISASFQGDKISNQAWAVTRKNFIISRKTEILSFGGSDGYDTSGRMYADFYGVFESNSCALMASLFGDTPGEVKAEDAKYILQVEILNIHSKASLSAFSDALFEIEIRFTIFHSSGQHKDMIAQTVRKKRVNSKMGTSLSYHRNAHRRANEAINGAFIEAREDLYRQLSTI